MPVVVTALEQLQGHGADAAVGEQALTAALDSPDGDVLFCDHEARADNEEKRRLAAEREVRRPSATGAEGSSPISAGGPPSTGRPGTPGGRPPPAAAPPKDGQERHGGRGWFRWRT
ncbi:hypothetical protein GCM10010236_08790 [Streptomyces eurythermus]|nr:hypothetical protein GCM10010236_08790 [Streptomyces eurythermus]